MAEKTGLSRVLWFSTFLLLQDIRQTTGITCYSCSYAHTGTTSGAECLEEPWNVTTANKVKCTRTDDVCVTIGVYAKAIKKYQSFSRGCGTNKKTCSSDVYFITCSERCETDLCNSGKLTIPGVHVEGGGGAVGVVSNVTPATVTVGLLIALLFL